MKPVATREQIQELAAYYLKACPGMDPGIYGLWAVEMLDVGGYIVPDHPQWDNPPTGPRLHAA